MLSSFTMFVVVAFAGIVGGVSVDEDSLEETMRAVELGITSGNSAFPSKMKSSALI